jgi:hypothetical protein
MHLRYNHVSIFRNGDSLESPVGARAGGGVADGDLAAERLRDLGS